MTGGLVTVIFVENDCLYNLPRVPSAASTENSVEKIFASFAP